MHRDYQNQRHSQPNYGRNRHDDRNNENTNWRGGNGYGSEGHYSNRMNAGNYPDSYGESGFAGGNQYGNYTSDRADYGAFDNDYDRHENRGFFERIGDGIRNTWNNLVGSDNDRDFNEYGNYNNYEDDHVARNTFGRNNYGSSYTPGRQNSNYGGYEGDYRQSGQGLQNDWRSGQDNRNTYNTYGQNNRGNLNWDGTNSQNYGRGMGNQGNYNSGYSGYGQAGRGSSNYPSNSGNYNMGSQRGNYGTGSSSFGQRNYGGNNYGTSSGAGNYGGGSANRSGRQSGNYGASSNYGNQGNYGHGTYGNRRPNRHEQNRGHWGDNEYDF